MPKGIYKRIFGINSGFKKGKKYPQFSGVNSPNWKGGRKTIIQCWNCKKEKEIWVYKLNSGRGKFCSAICKSEYQIGKPAPHPFESGENSIRWKGGQFKTHGRWYILFHDHPFVNKSGYVRRARLVAEECLGRYLLKTEVIHHINEIKDDDKPENLYLFSNNSKHNTFHKSKNKNHLISNIT